MQTVQPSEDAVYYFNWENIGTNPESLSRECYARDGNTLYIIGGIVNNGGMATTTKRVRVFDLVTEQYKADLQVSNLEGLYDNTAFVNNGTLYIFGGRYGPMSIALHGHIEINLSNGALNRVTDASFPMLTDCTGTMIGNTPYFTGGYNTDQTTRLNTKQITFADGKFNVYDSKAYSAFGITVLHTNDNEAAYLIGGFSMKGAAPLTNSGIDHTLSNYTEIGYTGSALEPRGYAAGFNYNGAFFVAGGAGNPVDGKYSLFSDILIQNSPSNDWVVAGALPVPMRKQYMTVVGDVVYLFGGLQRKPGTEDETPNTTIFRAEMNKVPPTDWKLSSVKSPMVVEAACLPIAGSLVILDGVNPSDRVANENAYFFSYDGDELVINTMPFERGNLLCKASAYTVDGVDDKFYLVGGHSSWTDRDVNNSIIEIDIDSGERRDLDQDIHCVLNASVFNVDGNTYMFGGAYGLDPTKHSNATYIWNDAFAPILGSRLLAHAPIARHAVFGKTAYFACGGLFASFDTTTHIFKTNLVGDNLPRYNYANIIATDELLYIVGGELVDGSWSGVVYEIDPNYNFKVRKLTTTPVDFKNYCAFISQGSIFILNGTNGFGVNKDSIYQYVLEA